MKLIVFGATGSVGIPLVKQALAQGHEVTAFTRSPEKLIHLENIHLRIFQGDVFNENDVEKALTRHDAVLCVIGDGSKGTVRGPSAKNMVAAMQKHQIKGLICQTTLGMGESRDNLNFFWKHLMFGLLLKKAYRDHQVQEQHILDSALDYTLVRPSALTDGPMTGKYKVGFPRDFKQLSFKISRADVADFMLRQLSSDAYKRKAVSISN